MVKITLEFPNIDAAIVALGKLAGAPSVPSKEAAAAPQGAATDAPAARRGRSDKGQKRGDYKPRTGKSEPAGAGGTETPTGAAPAPQTAPAGEASQPNAAGQSENAQVPSQATKPTTAPAATRAEAQSALEALVSGVNLDAGIKLLAEFGTQRLRDLPDEKLGEFVARAKAALPKVVA